MPKIIKINDVSVTIIRKNIKRIYVRLLSNGNFQVSAPYLYPEHTLIDLINENWKDFEIQRNKWLNRPKNTDSDLPENAEKILMDRLGVLIPECEKLVGTHASAYQLKNMTSRWGSCSRITGKISLNLKLAGKNDECLRMVIIHELVHFYVAGHGAEFTAYMDKFCPNWKKIRKDLNRS